MFRCQNPGCGVNVGPRVPARRVVTEMREKVYPERHGKINRVWDEEEEEFTWIGDKGGIGWEIVKQLSVCERCERIFLEKKMQ